jgi:hypothetical protein
MTALDRTSLDRVLPSSTGSPDWDDVMSRSRAQLGRRRRRVVVAIAAAALVAVGTASAFGAVRDIFRVGFIGLPPKGATRSAPESAGPTPTTPASGELVLSYWGPAAGNSDYGRGGVGKSRIWVYADGRLIFLREAAIPEGANQLFTGFLEQRLTPKGAELLRSEIVSAASLGHEPPADGEPVPFGTDIQVRTGNRLVRVDRASGLERLVARLTDPASWLPASAWQDREITAYEPSRYAVCYGAPQRIEPSRIFSLLPAPAVALLRTKERKEEGATGLYCSDATTQEARELTAALDDGGPAQGELGDGRGPERAYHLVWQFEVPGSRRETVRIFIEPYLPHGEWTCSPCG